MARSLFGRFSAFNSVGAAFSMAQTKTLNSLAENTVKFVGIRG
tara:strand:- start:816 stop:944 length:129 start_codon:yes stop_codon:yes gene_type:complete